MTAAQLRCKQRSSPSGPAILRQRRGRHRVEHVEHSAWLGERVARLDPARAEPAR